ncbi:hypothetical protein L3X38_043117 [Prunus dulcis]|uniref:Uncharacterized protein n=1 Tax=Prunus dulcis TaxID=3755 RepID=A0AAD4YLU6_PRUDU|nr:hypothetical protein L3X38_043117 [Prunus dulcis]
MKKARGRQKERQLRPMEEQIVEGVRLWEVIYFRRKGFRRSKLLKLKIGGECENKQQMKWEETPRAVAAGLKQPHGSHELPPLELSGPRV